MIKKYILNLTFWSSFIGLVGITTVWYYNYVIYPNQTGDLEDFGCIVLDGDKQNYRKQFEKLKPQNSKSEDVFLDISDDKILKYVNIGDSFSKLQGLKHTDFVAEELDEEFFNIQTSNSDPLNNAIGLLNSGFFAVHKTKAVVVQSVERATAYRIDNLNIDTLIDYRKMLLHRPPPAATNGKKPQLGVYQLLGRTYNWAMAQLKSIDVLIIEKCDRELFSIKPNYLYATKDDIKYNPELSEDELVRYYEKINYVNQRFKDSGIDFYFLVAVDKYDLYQDYIISNPYPRQKNLDQMSVHFDSTYFINSKPILKSMVERGVKDVFYAEDSHWSPIASKAIGYLVAKKIRSNEENTHK